MKASPLVGSFRVAERDRERWRGHAGMQMQPFEKWVVNSFSRLYLHWYLLPRFHALTAGTA